MKIENIFNSSEFQRDIYEFKVMDSTSITLSIIEAPFEHCLVIIKDLNDKIRLSTTFKSRKSTYTIHEDDCFSDNCAVGGKIDNGIWKIEIIRFYKIEGAYKLEILFNENKTLCDKATFNPMTFDVCKLVNNEKRWYRGDLHLHSYYTDGRVTLDEINFEINNKGLDFVAISDHSVFTNKFPITNALIIPSVEITFDNLGHYNIHGLNDFIDYGRYYVQHNGDKNKIIDEILKDSLRKGEIVCINHPFTYFWDIEHDLNVNSNYVIEVINSPHLIEKEVDNDKAIRFFDFLWCKGICMMAVGGSDAHKKNYNNSYPVGIPETNLFMDGLCIKNVIKSIKNGNCYISVNTIVDIKIYNEEDNFLPGDFVSGNITIYAKNNDNLKWEIVSNGEIVYSSIGNSVFYKLFVEKGQYYRLQARNVVSNEIVLFTNPIHNINISNENYKLLSLLEEFEKIERSN